MTYRTDGSYLRFPLSIRLTGGGSVGRANREQSTLIRRNRRQHRLQDTPAVTASQNAFEAGELEE